MELSTAVSKALSPFLADHGALFILSRDQRLWQCNPHRSHSDECVMGQVWRTGRTSLCYVADVAGNPRHRDCLNDGSIGCCLKPKSSAQSPIHSARPFQDHRCVKTARP